MKLIRKYTCFIILCFFISLAYAEPRYFITHNYTSLETRAEVGQDKSYSFKTTARTSSKVEWWMLQLRCGSQSVVHKCKAVMKAETNTEFPIKIGTLAIDLKSGEIMPKYISAKGYSISVLGAGEIHIYKNL